MSDNNDDKKKECETSYTKNIIPIVWLIVTIFAMFMSFKCNNGFNLGDFLLACCCSPLYIAYRLAVSNCFSNGDE